MATIEDIFLQDQSRVFTNVGGNGIAYGGTGQGGAITGNPTGGGGTGSSYGSDPYAGVTVVYNPVTGQTSTFDPLLFESITPVNGQRPNIVVGEELVLNLKQKLTLEFEGYVVTENGVATYHSADDSVSVTFGQPIILGPNNSHPLTLEFEGYTVYENGAATHYSGDASLSVTFEEPTIVGGVNDGRPLADVVNQQGSGTDLVIKRGAMVNLQKGGPIISFDIYSGTSGNDTIKGSGVLLGLEGHDHLTGSNGADILETAAPETTVWTVALETMISMAARVPTRWLAAPVTMSITSTV